MYQSVEVSQPLAQAGVREEAGQGVPALNGRWR